MPPSPPPHSAAPLVVGVLGGIASGKSLVARLLAGDGGAVVDADRLAREVLESPEVRSRLRERFGDEVFDERGEILRDALARRVFARAEDRKALESWTHPAVRARISAEVAALRSAGRSPIVLDVPLLAENDAEHGLARACDALVFVEVDRAERERRARTTRGWEPGELSRREAAQLPLDRKRALATHVISNRTDTNDLAAAVQRLRRELGLAG